MYDRVRPVTNETRTTLWRPRQAENCPICGQPVERVQLTAPTWFRPEDSASQ